MQDIFPLSVSEGKVFQSHGLPEIMKIFAAGIIFLLQQRAEAFQQGLGGMEICDDRRNLGNGRYDVADQVSESDDQTGGEHAV